MGLNCSQYSCCFNCIYRKRFLRVCGFGRNKTAPEDFDRSPPPSIALTIAGRSEADEQSIQDQLSLFHFGQKSSSGRRYSHPNQAKWVEEYERRKSQPNSPSPSIPPEMTEFDYDTTEVIENRDNREEEPQPKPPFSSPVMEYPVVPPGRLL